MFKFVNLLKGLKIQKWFISLCFCSRWGCHLQERWKVSWDSTELGIPVYLFQTLQWVLIFSNFVMNALPSVFSPEIKKLQNVLFFLMQTWSLYYPWRDGQRQQVAQVNVGTLSAQVANLKIKYVGSAMALIVIYIETGIDNMQKVDRLCELWVDCHGLVGCNPHVLSSLIHTMLVYLPLKRMPVM